MECNEATGDGVQGASATAALLAWLADAASVCARSVLLTNGTSEPLYLVDLGLHPNPRGLFFILDQHRLWRHNTTTAADDVPAAAQCLKLAPGTSHRRRRAPPEVPPHRGAPCQNVITF